MRRVTLPPCYALKQPRVTLPLPPSARHLHLPPGVGREGHDPQAHLHSRQPIRTVPAHCRPSFSTLSLPPPRRGWCDCGVLEAAHVNSEHPGGLYPCRDYSCHGQAAPKNIAAPMVHLNTGSIATSCGVKKEVVQQALPVPRPDPRDLRTHSRTVGPEALGPADRAARRAGEEPRHRL